MQEEFDLEETEGLDHPLVQRAVKAYFRRCEWADQPSSHYSGLYNVNDRWYVALANGGGILAAYRVRENGEQITLKRLLKGPKALEVANGVR